MKKLLKQYKNGGNLDSIKQLVGAAAPALSLIPGAGIPLSIGASMLTQMFEEGGMPNLPYEAEDSEVVMGNPKVLNGGNTTKLNNNAVELNGKSHSEGGIKAVGGDYIFSDKLKPLGSKKTFAEIAKSLNKKLGKVEKNNITEIDKKTVELTKKDINSQLAKLAAAQEQMNSTSTNMFEEGGPIGGGNQPTTQDSLILYNRALEVQKYFENPSFTQNGNSNAGLEDTYPQLIDYYNKISQTNQNIVKKLNNNIFEISTDFPKAGELGQPPTPVFHKKIPPHYSKVYSNSINNNNIVYAGYDPLKIKPVSMLTDKERKLRGLKVAPDVEEINTIKPTITSDIPLREIPNEEIKYQPIEKMKKYYAGMNKKEEEKRLAGKPYKAISSTGKIINVVSGDVSLNNGKDRIRYDKGNVDIEEAGDRKFASGGNPNKDGLDLNPNYYNTDGPVSTMLPNNPFLDPAFNSEDYPGMYPPYIEKMQPSVLKPLTNGNVGNSTLPTNNSGIQTPLNYNEVSPLASSIPSINSSTPSLINPDVMNRQMDMNNITDNMNLNNPATNSPNYLGLLNTATKLAPTLYNLGQGIFGKKDYYKAEQNPMKDEALGNLNSSLNYEIGDLLESNRSGYQANLANINRMTRGNSGEAIRGILSAQNLKQQQDAQTYGAKSRYEADANRSAAQIKLGLGEQDRQENVSEQIKQLQLDALKRRMLSTGLEGVSQYSQMNELNRNRNTADKARIETLKQMFPYTAKYYYTPEFFQNLGYGN